MFMMEEKGWEVLIMNKLGDEKGKFTCIEHQSQEVGSKRLCSSE